MKRWVVSVASGLLLLLLFIPQLAHAFCGFYVTGSDQQLAADATQVVLMRKGTRTVLSMQNNYKGPPEAFAMVVPVPVVLHPAQVQSWLRTLTDLRLVVADRLQVDPNGVPQLHDEESQVLGDVYDWLGMVQESLVYAIDA